MGFNSYSGVTNRQENTNIEIFFGLSLPDAVVDWSFDPSGQYVVFAIWNQSAMPLEFDQTISKNVLDSTLVLVDWRTKQSIELLKLSKVDPQNYIIQWGGSLRWSSDGSTLLVPREGAEALVLKLKYPSGTNLVIDEPASIPEELATQTPLPTYPPPFPTEKIIFHSTATPAISELSGFIAYDANTPPMGIIKSSLKI